MPSSTSIHLALALFMEGFMSAFYHICPTNANFQFGKWFMIPKGLGPGVSIRKTVEHRTFVV